MKKIFELTVFLTLLWTAAAPAWAQGSAVSLPEVVVTAVSAVAADAAERSLTVPGAAAAKEAMQKVPGGVAVVDKADYATGRASTPT